MRGAVSFVIIVAMFALCACERDDQQIKVYRVAKAPLESTPPPDSSMMPTNASSPSASSLTAPGASNVAEVPKNWEPQPLSQMRLASFLVRGANGATADVSFVMLGPAAGNVLDNVNRWLGQIKQPPVSEEKLKSMIQPMASSSPGTKKGIVSRISSVPRNGVSVRVTIHASAEAMLTASSVLAPTRNTVVIKMR